MSKFIYRACRDDENPQEGIFIQELIVECDRAEWIKWLVYHINNASRDKVKKRFISLTENFECALKYARGKDNENKRETNIILVNTEKSSSNLTYIKGNDLLVKEMEEYGVAEASIEKLIRYSADCEVLSDNNISKESYKILSPIMVDVLYSINSTILPEEEDSNWERKMLEFVQSAYFDSSEFEEILHDTEELNVYEQYFYERFYCNRFSLEQIQYEMNDSIKKIKNIPGKIELETLECLRVSTIKKLLNSDKMLVFLKQYNENSYKSSEINELLDSAINEKEKINNPEIIRRKDVGKVKLNSRKRRLKKSRELYDEKKKELSKLGEILEKKNRLEEKKEVGKSNNFIDELSSLVYSVDESDYHKLLGEIKKINNRNISLEQEITKLESQFRKSMKYTAGRGLLNGKYKGLVIKDKGRKITLKDKKIRMTGIDYIKQIQSNGRIACGEFGFCTVDLQSDLKYVDRAESIVNGNNTILYVYSTEWERKKLGGELNTDRINANRNLTPSPTLFGLAELTEISNSSFVSEKLKEKIEKDRTRCKETIEICKNEDARENKENPII